MFDFVPILTLLTNENDGTNSGIPYAIPSLFGSNAYFTANFLAYIMHSSMLTTTYKQGLGFSGPEDITSNTYTYGKKASDGKTFFWYNTKSDLAQCNRPATSQQVYHYSAIG